MNDPPHSALDLYKIVQFLNNGCCVQALIASTLNLLLQSWCVQKGGPFIVSLYVPLQMLMVAILSVLILKDTLYLGM